MSLVGIVSLLIFATLGIAHQQQQKGEIDRSLDMALNEHDSFGVRGFGFGRNFDALRSGARTPVYCVTVLNDGTIYENSTSSISLDDIDTSEIDEAALTIVNTGEQQGELADQGVFFCARTTITGTRIAFADTTSYKEQIGGFYLMLFGLWLILMLLVFFITLFLSRLVTRPVSQAWETQQQFIADASHELKTPLTVIMANASILSANPEKTVQEQQQWVEGISAEAGRMQELTEGMLMLAQADAGVDMSQIMARVDLSELVEASLLTFEAVAFERGLTIDESIEGGLHVQGDALRLEGLLKTLLENACKYSEKPGTVDIGLRAAKGNAVLAVHNAGNPIPPEDLPHVFDRFYRSDKSRVREGETTSFGLGLSIAKSTVQMHGGSISCDSGPQGTTFTVTLPLDA